MINQSIWGLVGIFEEDLVKEATSSLFSALSRSSLSLRCASLLSLSLSRPPQCAREERFFPLPLLEVRRHPPTLSVISRAYAKRITSLNLISFIFTTNECLSSLSPFTKASPPPTVHLIYDFHLCLIAQPPPELTSETMSSCREKKVRPHAGSLVLPCKYLRGD